MPCACSDCFCTSGPTIVVIGIYEEVTTFSEFDRHIKADQSAQPNADNLVVLTQNRQAATPKEGNKAYAISSGRNK